jgi:hypothetical protein
MALNSINPILKVYDRPFLRFIRKLLPKLIYKIDPSSNYFGSTMSTDSSVWCNKQAFVKVTTLGPYREANLSRKG